MTLDQFVETSIRQIIESVKRAQVATRLQNKHISEADVINPGVMYDADYAPKGKYFSTITRNLVHFVDFDVAVTTDSKDEDKSGLSLKVMGIGFDMGDSTLDRSSVVSRIKFQVPILLPRSEDEQS
jgi:hypothetical protein